MFNYLKLFKSYPKAISFGFLQNLFAGFGQTFFISLFLSQILEQFNLTKTSYGSIYALATFLAAFVMPYWGRLIDKKALSKIAKINAAGLILACGLFYSANNAILLFFALVFLRLFGQAAMPLLGQTSISKQFHQSRGKALSLANLGAPVSEAIYPPLVAILLSLISWQNIWLLILVCILFLYIPLTHTFCKNMKTETNSKGAKQSTGFTSKRHWTLKEVLKDYRFYCFLPGGVFPAFSLTASFFYQLPLAEERGWSLGFIASAFSFFAILRFCFALIGGPILDKVSGLRMLRFYLLPMLVGFFFIGFFTSQWTVFLYYILIGITVGLGANIKSAIWAELYGTKYLGQIKGIYAFIAVTATAISPAIFGYYLDNGLLVTEMLQLFALIGVICQILLLLVKAQTLKKIQS